MSENIPAQNACCDTTENTQDFRTVTPAADIYETKSGYQLLAEVPGAGQDDINLSIEDDTLRMEARAGHYAQSKVKYLRDFRVGKGLNLDNVQATLRNGVLAIHLPKADAAQPKLIQVLSNNN